MEVDFSDKITNLPSGEMCATDITEKLTSILDSSIASDLNQIGIDSIDRLKAIYRRGAASFDHIHMIGVSRMQLGLARVIHVLGTPQYSSDLLDYDLVHNDKNCGSWYLDEKAEEVFFGYDSQDLSLAKVKLTEAGIEESSRDLVINLEK